MCGFVWVAGCVLQAEPEASAAAGDEEMKDSEAKDSEAQGGGEEVAVEGEEEGVVGGETETSQVAVAVAEVAVAEDAVADD